MSHSVSNAGQRIYSRTSSAENERLMRYNDQLDVALEDNTPWEAFPIEAELLERNHYRPTLSADLARLTFKAIATAHYARQIDSEAHQYKDTTYQKIGSLLAKSLASLEQISRSRYTNKEDYAAHRSLAGITSEGAAYALLAYNSAMSRSMTGRMRRIPVHFTLPATDNEDYAAFRATNGLQTGIDLKIFTDDTRERTLGIQVKTSEFALGDKLYAPGIIPVTLDTLLPDEHYDETRLARYIAADAAGRYSRISKLALNKAVKNLDDMIMNSISEEETA